MKPIRIGKRIIAPGQPSYIIAEVGANHDRDLGIAHRMIDVAADVGADAVKFQTYSAETLYSKYAPRLKEMGEFGRSPEGESPFELIKRIEMPREWQQELRDHAVERGIEFLSTPFDLEAVRELSELNVKAFKIASYELIYYRLIRAAAKTGLPVILSTGNSGMEDIHRAVAAVKAEGNDNVIVLHCVSQYPTNYEDLHMSCLPMMQRELKVPIGFSDHTMDPTAAAMAVALGACCFEKHFTLDRERKGPDHPSASEPDELATYIQAIRNAEKAMGVAEKAVRASEEENHRLGRRSIHAFCNIAKGTQITAEMLTMKRPALGIHPFEEDNLVGKVATIDIKEDQWITWDMVNL